MTPPPRVLPPPPSQSRCECGGAVALARLKISGPLVPACRRCGTPTPAARERAAKAA